MSIATYPEMYRTMTLMEQKLSYASVRSQCKLIQDQWGVIKRLYPTEI